MGFLWGKKYLLKFAYSKMQWFCGIVLSVSFLLILGELNNDKHINAMEMFGFSKMVICEGYVGNVNINP